MKIAVVTDDGKTICQHFGRAKYYLVVEIQEGRIVDGVLRPKAGHHTRGHEHGYEHGHNHDHDHGADSRHRQMVETIRDCRTVLVGHMGPGAREALSAAGITPRSTEIREIDEAVRRYLDGMPTTDPGCDSRE